MRQRATLFRSKFTASVRGGPHIEVVGNFWGHEYTLRQGRLVVARVSAKWLSVTDAYSVNVAAGAGHVLMLAVVVIVQPVVEC